MQIPEEENKEKLINEQEKEKIEKLRAINEILYESKEQKLISKSPFKQEDSRNKKFLLMNTKTGRILEIIAPTALAAMNVVRWRKRNTVLMKENI